MTAQKEAYIKVQQLVELCDEFIDHFRDPEIAHDKTHEGSFHAQKAIIHQCWTILESDSLEINVRDSGKKAALEKFIAAGMKITSLIHQKVEIGPFPKLLHDLIAIKAELCKQGIKPKESQQAVELASSRNPLDYSLYSFFTWPEVYKKCHKDTPLQKGAWGATKTFGIGIGVELGLLTWLFFSESLGRAIKQGGLHYDITKDFITGLPSHNPIEDPFALLNVTTFAILISLYAMRVGYAVWSEAKEDAGSVLQNSSSIS